MQAGIGHATTIRACGLAGNGAEGGRRGATPALYLIAGSARASPQQHAEDRARASGPLVLQLAEDRAPLLLVLFRADQALVEHRLQTAEPRGVISVGRGRSGPLLRNG